MLSIHIFKDGSKTVLLMAGENAFKKEFLDVLKFTTDDDSNTIAQVEKFEGVPLASLPNRFLENGKSVIFTKFHHEFGNVNYLDYVECNSNDISYKSKSLPIVVYNLLRKLCKHYDSDFYRYMVSNTFLFDGIKPPKTIHDLIQYLMELNAEEQKIHPDTEYFDKGETKYREEINKYYIISHTVLLTAEVAGLTSGSLFIKNDVSKPWGTALLVISGLSLMCLHFVISSKMSLKVIQAENSEEIPRFSKRFLMH